MQNAVTERNISCEISSVSSPRLVRDSTRHLYIHELSKQQLETLGLFSRQLLIMKLLLFSTCSEVCLTDFRKFVPDFCFCD